AFPVPPFDTPETRITPPAASPMAARAYCHRQLLANAAIAASRRRSACDLRGARRRRVHIHGVPMGAAISESWVLYHFRKAFVIVDHDHFSDGVPWSVADV